MQARIVSWFFVVGALVALYLLGALALWATLRWATRRALARLKEVGDLSAAMAALEARVADARQSWPAGLRAAPYAELDGDALVLLRQMDDLLLVARDFCTAPLFFAPMSVGLLGALTYRSAPPLAEALGVYRNLGEYLHVSEEIGDLGEQVEAVADRVRSLCRGCRDAIAQTLDHLDDLEGRLQAAGAEGLPDAEEVLQDPEGLRDELYAVLAQVDHDQWGGAPPEQIEGQAREALAPLLARVEGAEQIYRAFVDSRTPPPAPEPEPVVEIEPLPAAPEPEPVVEIEPLPAAPEPEPISLRDEQIIVQEPEPLTWSEEPIAPQPEPFPWGEPVPSLQEPEPLPWAEPAPIVQEPEPLPWGEPVPSLQEPEPLPWAEPTPIVQEPEPAALAAEPWSVPELTYPLEQTEPDTDGETQAPALDYAQSAPVDEMAPTYDDPVDDPAYQQAMTAMQTGRWTEAIETLERLRQTYPGSAKVASAVEWAAMRAEMDGRVRIKPRRTLVRWRRLVFGTVSVVLLLGLGAFVVQAAAEYLVPMLEERAEARAYAQLVRRCDDLLGAGSLEEAIVCYEQALQQRPDDPHPAASLVEIRLRQEVEAAYAACVVAFEGEDRAAALALCMEVQRIAPGYADVQELILTLTRLERLDGLYREATALREAGDLEGALELYRQIATLDTRYRAEEIEQARFTLYMEQGRAITEAGRAEAGLLLQADERFAQALRLRPTNAEAQQERRLITLFSEGLTRYQQSQWEQAIVSLRTVYEQRPTYFAATLVPMLYDAFMRSGDDFRAAGDIASAYERYLQASLLPVPDTTMAQARLIEVFPLVTPTLTPTPTPIPTPTPRRVATPRPPVTVGATPRPLAAFAGQIVFRSDNLANPGFWVRDAQGGNPRFVGNDPTLAQQYQALLERYMRSPDGRYRAFVRSTGHEETAIFVELPPEERVGGRTFEQLTNLRGLSYDPAWSPDGSRIVFVSQDTASDDIWIVNADGSGLRNLTPRERAWDKRPSWSPDGTRIVFWSDREGRMQLFTMDPDGRNVRNISQTAWEEYDPLWIR